MSAYKKFDPYHVPEPSAKAAKVANEIRANSWPPARLASLATLAALPAQSAKSSFPAGLIEHDSGERHARRVTVQAKVPTDRVMGVLRMAEKPCLIAVEDQKHHRNIEQLRRECT